MWQYRANFVRAVDGDTVDLLVDLGFKIYAKIRVRVVGVDTPERGEDGYREATEFVERWFEQHEGECHIETEKTGKYGRWLAKILPPGEVDGDLSLNQALLDSEMGVPYE